MPPSAPRTPAIISHYNASAEDKRAAIAAVVHVDGTGRLQTVSERELPRFHALMRAFEAETTVPVLLNTSFNIAGEPIVCSPEDACRCYKAADLDGLVLGDLWISKRGATARKGRAASPSSRTSSPSSSPGEGSG